MEAMIERDEVLDSLFNIPDFVQNDSRADIYSVTDMGELERQRVAYAFITDRLPGNCQAFANRKLKRLRMSATFLRGFCLKAGTACI
jgi:hypothetical protein